MTKERLSINIPFSGFYESLYSAEIDRFVEMDSEHYAEQDSLALPEEMRVTADQFAEALNDAMDYSIACHNVARAYVHGFNAVMRDILGFDLGLEFEEMTSPREYNFQTDRIFCYISRESVARLVRMVRADGYSTLAAQIRRRFTSRDGFISHYRNDLADWLAKPVSSWDHNELGTLLLAAMDCAPDADDDWQMSVYYAACDDGCYSEISESIDWPKYESAIAEIRADLAAEFEAENPGYEPPVPRCQNTPDLFTGRVGY